MNQDITITHTARANPVRWPLMMAFIRLPLILAGSAVAILVYQLSGQPVGIAAGLGWSTLTLTIVNVICLWLLTWRAGVEGFRLRDIIGFQWRRLLPDIGWGLVWSLVLGALLLAGVFATLLVWFGEIGADTFETAFVGKANFSFSLPPWLAVLSAVIWPLSNAPVEEIQFRGYAQPRLVAAWNSLLSGILVTALGFGLQHTVFAVTVPAALAYCAGFFLWGSGAGIIAHRQKRLFPLVFAHFISNLSFGVVPLLIITGAR